MAPGLRSQDLIYNNDNSRSKLHKEELQLDDERVNTPLANNPTLNINSLDQATLIALVQALTRVNKPPSSKGTDVQ